MSIEPIEQIGRVGIAQRPPAANDGVCAGLEECMREAQYAFPALDGARRCLATREHDDAAFQVESLDLTGLQQTIFPGITGREQYGGALRVRLVGYRVRREVEDIVGAHVCALQRVL